jgi:hypothetical protein
MLNWYRSLIALRRSPRFLESLTAPSRVKYCDEKNWLLIERGDLTIASNFSAQAQRISVPSSGERQVLLGSRPSVSISNEAIDLPPESVAVLIRAPES